jgi:thymidylate synthase
MTYQKQYKKLVKDILAMPDIPNDRTKQTIQRYNGTIVLRHDNYGIPIVGGRKAYLHSGAAECAWFLMGTKNCNWLNEHTGMWKQWQVNNEVTAGYGYRWRNALGYDQIEAAINNLKKDKTTRRIWISSWDPKDDCNLNAINVPCPVGFYIDIINKKLNMSVVMRSSDVAVGLVYDTITFRCLQAVIAASLKIDIGFLEFILINAHIYQNQKATITELLKTNNLNVEINIPLLEWPLNKVLKNPDSFVNNYKKMQLLIPFPAIKMEVAI